MWEENKFGVALTHDIDTCRSAWLEGSFSELKKKRFITIPKLILKHVLGKDDWFNFKTITQLRKEKIMLLHHIIFYLKKVKIDKLKNADYKVESKRIQQDYIIMRSRRK